MSSSRSVPPRRIHARLVGFSEHRNISIAVFVDTVGAGLILPLSLVYFTLTTNVPLAHIGLLASIAALVALPAGLIGGALTDRFDARVAMVANNLISAVGYSLYLVAREPVGVFAALLLTAASERLYWASWTAYVHRLSAGRPFERWFSFLEAMKMGAMGFGGVASAIVLTVSAVTGLKWLIFTNVLTSLVAAVIFIVQKMPPAVGTAHDERGRELHQASEHRERQSESPTVGAEHRVRRREPRAGIRAWIDVFRDPGAVLVVSGQFFLGPIMVLPNAALSVLFVIIWHLPAAVSPVMFAINTVLIAVLQTPVTRAVERTRRAVQLWIAAGLVVACLVPPMFLSTPGMAEGWVYVCAVAAVLAVADILYLPPTNAIMAEAASPHLRGRAIGVHQTAFALSMALYPALIGLLHSGVPWLLWALSCASIVAGALFYSLALRGPLRHLARANEVVE